MKFFKIFVICLLTVSIIVLPGCRNRLSKDDSSLSENNGFSIVHEQVTTLPVFVENKDALIDTESKYVTSDGLLWSYEAFTTEALAFTNQISSSKDKDGKTVGLVTDVRYNSADLSVTCVGACSTGYIPVAAGDTIRFVGIQFRNETVDSVAPGSIYLRFYDASYKVLYSFSAYSFAEYIANISSDFSIDEEGNLAHLTLNSGFEYAYMRMTFIPQINKEPAIAVNEEVEKEVDEYYKWVSQAYIVADWHDEVISTINDVNELELVEEKPAQFLFVSDIHLEPNFNNYGLIQNIGKVAAGVMQSCKIPYLLVTGDSTTQSPSYTLADLKDNMQQVLNILEPIPQNNIVLTVGNHDGATGLKKENGKTLNYRYQLSNWDRKELYFGWQRANSAKKFSSDGSYYYLDDPITKTRYIMLNSFWSEYEGDDEGFVTDEQHSFFHNPLFGQEQLIWFATEALNMPNGYSAVIATHNVFETKDRSVLRDIIEAYQNKATCSSVYNGEQTWQNSSVSADFTNAQGEIIAIFQGHFHKDAVNTTTYPVPCITITTAGSDIRDDNPAERVVGTATETAIDIVTIDKTNRIIYTTRLGVGDDRKISY